MSPLQYFFLLVLIAIVFTIGYFENYADAGQYVWAGGEKGIRQVPVFYVDDVYCNEEDENVKGCYDPNDDIILVKSSHKDQWVSRGCSILLHEQGHAWGLSEAQLHIFDCPNPHIDPNKGQYEKDNIHHWDPLYEHKPHNSAKLRTSWK